MSYNGFMKPLQPDKVLAGVVGTELLPRIQIVKKVWSYIREHGLQDTEDKRIIWTDDKLQAVFGGKKQVNMFEVTRLVNEHLRE